MHQRGSLNNQHENTMTNSAPTTQSDQPPKTRQSRTTITTHHNDDSSSNATQQHDDQENDTHDQNNEWRHNIANILSNFWCLNHTTSINTRRKTVLMIHMHRQDIADVCAEFNEEAPDVDDEDSRSRTRTRGQFRATPTHHEAVHDARTQRRHQPRGSQISRKVRRSNSKKSGGESCKTLSIGGMNSCREHQKTAEEVSKFAELAGQKEAVSEGRLQMCGRDGVCQA